MRLEALLGQKLDSAHGETGSVGPTSRCPLLTDTNPWEHTADKHREEHHFRLDQNKIPRGFG